MEISLRPTVGPEYMYSYTQSQQLIMQSGNIGYLRADMDSNGMGFYTTWNDYRPSYNTQEFKDELDKVIDTFRKDERFGKFLGNRNLLKGFCRKHPEARIPYSADSFVFRADTKDYTYMLRLNPNRGEYNLYCYCYRRESLERHMRNAERGIRIIDSNYNEKFRIADGEKMRLVTAGGEFRDMRVRYIDDYHMETYAEWGNNLYHICEFAERFEERGCQDIYPLRSTLPDRCYSVLDSTGEIIIIQKGEKGYYHIEHNDNSREENRQRVDEINAKAGITRAQEEAMKAGSMFGWAVPAADPKNYDADGKLLKSKFKERGDER